jgi:hypothetical protein
MFAILMAGLLLVIVTAATVLAFGFVREWSDDDIPDRTAILDRLDPHRHTVKRSASASI